MNLIKNSGNIFLSNVNVLWVHIIKLTTRTDHNIDRLNRSAIVNTTYRDRHDLFYRPKDYIVSIKNSFLFQSALSLSGFLLQFITFIFKSQSTSCMHAQLEWYSVLTIWDTIDYITLSCKNIIIKIFISWSSFQTRFFFIFKLVQVKEVTKHSRTMVKSIKLSLGLIIVNYKKKTVTTYCFNISKNSQG